MATTTTEKLSPEEQTALRFYLQSLARELMPDERVAICMRRRVSAKEFVEIRYNENIKKAWYANLIRCGSVWMCAYCSEKISEGRRRELADGIGNNLNRYLPLLVTWTISHHAGQSLESLLAAMHGAYRWMKSGRSWQLIKDEFMIRGSIRGLEITHGSNGWHPHYHELMLLDSAILEYDPDLNTTGYQNGIQDRKEYYNPLPAVQRLATTFQTHLFIHYWKPALARFHLEASIAHGITITHSHDEIIEYIAKHGHLPERDNPGWGAEHELTKANWKAGRAGNRTPNDLLLDYGRGDLDAGRLWQEYASAVKGRSQLQWTKGLKEDLGLTIQSDMDMVNSDPEPTHILSMLTPDQWRCILRGDKRAQVLKIASTGDIEALHRYLSTLEGWDDQT
jgi:hypothetical protein